MNRPIKIQASSKLLKGDAILQSHLKHLTAGFPILVGGVRYHIITAYLNPDQKAIPVSQQLRELFKKVKPTLVELPVQKPIAREFNNCLVSGKLKMFANSVRPALVQLCRN